MKKPKPQVAIIMGSDSDWPKLERAQKVLEDFGVGVHVEVVSAHRTPEDLEPFAKRAETRGLQVIIAGAGGAAHLPGMMASYISLPVIGVPIEATSLHGLDALLSIAQMPFGIPVACMAVENSGNAALFAVRILSLKDTKLRQKLRVYKKTMATQSRHKNKTLNTLRRNKTS